MPALTFSNSEHLGAACWAHALGRWLAVLHGYAPGIPHLPFGAAFHAVSLHYPTLLSY